MFVGAINPELRSILYELAGQWKDIPVVVGCSGNFTVERVLNQAGITNIYSNDVSLYSCAIGSYLAGVPLEVQIKDTRFDWLEKYITPGPPLIATLLLCSAMFNNLDKDKPYFKRMLNAYIKDWGSMFSRTEERVKKALDGVKIAGFFPGDVMDHIVMAPQDCVVISFPPTYKAGYERLYKKIDEVFEWVPPNYTIFDETRFAEFTSMMMEKEQWVTLRDEDVPELKDCLIGLIKTGARSKPVRVYAKTKADSKLVMFRQKCEKVPIKRLQGELKGKLSLVLLSQGQMNTLRSEYLSTGIAPASCSIRLGVLVGGELIGAFGFSESQYVKEVDAYLMSDFAIRPTIYRKLSKLVLVAVLSTETQAILEQWLNRRIRTIMTTAFTQKAVSMKYRGLFSIHNKKEDHINYIANLGRWSLEGGVTVVEGQPLGNFVSINQTLEQLGYPYQIALVRFEELEFLEKNARYMTNEQFSNLADNIKRDGALSSVPFCLLKPDGKYKVLSGNHRLQAGHAAGIDRFLILYTDKELSQQEQVSIQLSHNAIEGKDDPVILTELWKEIQDVELKYYSGLDDKLMAELEKVSIAPLSEVNLDFRAVSFVFLPEELERVKEALANALKMISGDEVFLARMKEYDQMMDALAKTQASYDVKNIATSLMLILDLFQRHQTELAEGWQEEAEPSKTRSWVPLASILGTDLVPASAAQVIQKAVQRMMDSGELTKKNFWQAIEYWATGYLAGTVETKKVNKEELN